MKQDKLNLMLDFETLGTEPDCVVISLGCVLFDDRFVKSQKYIKFNIQSQLDVRRSVTESTLKWWNEQSADAREVFNRHGTPEVDLGTFISQLTSWLNENDATEDNLLVWGNGATFDVAILHNIFKQKRQKQLYRYGNVRCYRTFAVETGCKDLIPMNGTKHHALDDALHQTRCLLAYRKKQRETKLKGIK